MNRKLFFLLVYILIISMLCESCTFIFGGIGSISDSKAKARQSIEELKTIPSGTEIFISSFSSNVILTGKFVRIDETELIIAQEENQISIPLADIKRVKIQSQRGKNLGTRYGLAIDVGIIVLFLIVMKGVAESK